MSGYQPIRPMGIMAPIEPTTGTTPDAVAEFIEGWRRLLVDDAEMKPGYLAGLEAGIRELLHVELGELRASRAKLQLALARHKLQPAEIPQGSPDHIASELVERWWASRDANGSVDVYDLVPPVSAALQAEREARQQAEQRAAEAERALLSARDRFYVEAAGNQCWRCFQEIPHEWEHDERFHVTDHPLAGRKRYPCKADGIWLALRHQQQAIAE